MPLEGSLQVVHERVGQVWRFVKGPVRIHEVAACAQLRRHLAADIGLLTVGNSALRFSGGAGKSEAGVRTALRELAAGAPLTWADAAGWTDVSANSAAVFGCART